MANRIAIVGELETQRDNAMKLAKETAAAMRQLQSDCARERASLLDEIDATTKKGGIDRFERAKLMQKHSKISQQKDDEVLSALQQMAEVQTQLRELEVSYAKLQGECDAAVYRGISAVSALDAVRDEFAAAAESWGRGKEWSALNKELSLLDPEVLGGALYTVGHATDAD